MARIGAAGLGAAVVGLAATSGAGSAAATNGIGSGTVSTSAVNATLGDLLGLTLLEDVASSTTDAKLGTVGATSRFRQVKLTSTLADAVPSLNEQTRLALMGMALIASGLGVRRLRRVVRS